MAVTLALKERSKHLLASLPSRNVNLLIQWEDNMGDSNKEDTVHPALSAMCAHVGVYIHSHMCLHNMQHHIHKKEKWERIWL